MRRYILILIFTLYVPTAFAQVTSIPTQESDAFNRIAQSQNALGAGMRLLYDDVTNLVTVWQKKFASQADQLDWWSKCAKQIECLDWIKLGARNAGEVRTNE